ncbi:MAG: hypothetical protein ACK4X1_14335 [Terricaulis sp.]
MVLLRCLLTGLMVVAVAQFGVLATAPAHAHEGDGHGVREVALVHDFGASQTQGHAKDGHQDGHDDDAAASPETPAPDDSSHGENAHVHACPQFTQAAAGAGVKAPVVLLQTAWPGGSSPAVSYSSSPPLRPPRSSL